ncbi:hypothetical protein MUP35_01290 [Patescibacteria group bacterium]|nr:hypothetical protein [Patescibacteria group bacterium]
MRRIPKKFIYPVALVMILDFLFTVIGQPSNYWTNFGNVDEGSPLGFNLLRIKPLFFLIFCAIYLLVMMILIRKSPLFIGATLGLSLFLGHVWGSSTWVYTLFHKMGFNLRGFSNWYLTVGYFILISLITVLIVTKEKRS